ncbi:DUF6228 family protein [Paenarthrobacter nicotinovorans]|uniref:DUF6228 family protein n=1 Tax=Paenarthrobacter nicotinovorans TaxID=29320 RepID=UPI0011A9B6D4|nr:DUF6228 family protein [Paenarthrobacter nicotinovorans]
MDEVVIGHHGVLIVRAERKKPNSDGTSEYLIVTADLGGLRASKRVYDFDGWSALLSYFEELERDWRGWDGDKSFDSLERDFRLSAKHDGHVRVTFEIENFDRPDPWTAMGVVNLDPGEELTAAVESLRALLTAR